MGKRSFAISIGVFLLAGFLNIALDSKTVFASAITDDLKATIDRIIEIVSDESLINNKPVRRQKLRDTIGKKFNYKQMVMRSLARNWNDRSDREKKEFIILFKKLLENSYANKIENYSDEKIEYIGETVKGKFALVKTKIVRKDSNVSVDYKMIKENGNWMVYDFIIEGVSMVRNYRSQFTKIIHKDSYEGLVKKLSEKIKKLEADNGKVAQGKIQAGENL